MKSKKIKILKYLFPISFILSIAIVSSISIFMSVKRQKEIHYIKSEAGLKSIVNDLSGHYIIDSPDGIKLSSGWVPIGDKDHPFTGILDCNYVSIYASDFDSSYIAEKANEGEVLLGLFAVNRGIIKHLGLSFSKTTITDLPDIKNNYTIVCGSACALNYGYISMCFVASTPSITTTNYCQQVILGGIAGINYKQIRCCSVLNSINIDVQDTKVIVGGIAGICENNSKLQYCIRNGFLWVNSNYLDYIVCGQCVGISKGGVIDNISITSNEISPSYKTFSYINSANICIGGLIGEVESSNLNIDRININTSFELRKCSACEFGFLFGRISGSNSKITLKNTVITGEFRNNYYENYQCGYLSSSWDSTHQKSLSIYAYDVLSNFELRQKEFVHDTSFSSIRLKDVNFDPACWSKGNYSFILNIEKMK